MKYTVIFNVFASCSDSVEADSPEEAFENAEPYVSLCHQCSRELEVGDVDYDNYTVLDEDGEEVLTKSSQN